MSLAHILRSANVVFMPNLREKNFIKRKPIFLASFDYAYIPIIFQTAGLLAAH